MAGVSLTVRKDRGPYDNKTPAALCPFNTNFLALEEQVLFFYSERRHNADKPNKCKAAMQNHSTEVPRNHWVELLLKEENNKGAK